MLGADALLLRTSVGDFVVGRAQPGATRAPGDRDAVRRFVGALRFAVASGEPLALQVAQTLLGDTAGSATGSIPNATAALADLVDRVEQALLDGRLVASARELSSFTERRDEKVPELPPLPPPARERGTSTFELRLLDETGKAISGVEAEFAADGLKTRRTNAAGMALLEDVTTSSAAATIADAKGLDAALDPRWQKPRPGVPPKEANTREVEFRGQALGPFPLKAEVPNTVVLKPPRGKLFVELFDKSGRVRHRQRTFQITGPETFEGTTDDEGRILVPSVFPGDYQLSLALDFFEKDADRVIDVVDSPLIVVETSAAAPQIRSLGIVPRSVLARLQLFFNTNKTFLLPTALPAVKKLRKLYRENKPCKLLVVGHADTRGGAAFNDKLSLERAEATIAYLKDDVEAWFKFYSDGDVKKRWGKTEDHLMIISMPDFVTKPKGEDEVEFYQRTRRLKVDGTAGKETRKALIKEYMSLDGTSLSNFVGEIDAVAHGCGESFPLDDSGEALDAAPADQKRDPTDRRVELFFFDEEFGITPPPPGKNSKPGSPEYPLWRQRVVETVELRADELDGPKVTFVELADAHFRTNSAVVLPEGENPDQKGDHRALTSVGLIATALRFNEEHGGLTVLVAGHTDTTADDAVNDKLSKERAALTLALLEGDRDSFRKLAKARNKGSDINQILSWISEAFEDLTFDCKPAVINDSVSDVPVRNFQRDFNKNKAALGSTAADLTPDGSVGELTWGAFFDCYEHALVQELGVDAAGLAALRAKLKFADPKRKSLGFGERFPVEELGVDEFRSQTNRRVEILFFQPGEAPDLARAEEDPETSELYLPGFFQRAGLPPMLSAKPFRASWDDVTTNMQTTRQLLVALPGIPADTDVLINIFQSPGGNAVATISAGSDEGSVSVPFEDWHLATPVGAVDLKAGQPFPPVSFSFDVECGGRSVKSSNQVTYADTLEMVAQLDVGDSILPNENYILCSPWGSRSGVTDADGVLREGGLPPGGSTVALRGRILLVDGPLDYGWDFDA